jgi:tRNA (cytidine/uridine-2'-O-)-methyltransferase
LVHPFGFKITDANLRRAGMDYWVHLDWHQYDNVDQWLAAIPDFSRVFLFSAHAGKSYLEQEFRDGDWLVFGKESVGLSEGLLERFENHLTIPISALARSFNVANAVAFAVGEARRQIGLNTKR